MLSVMKNMRNQFIRSKVVYQKHVRKGSLIDDIFNRIMRHEVEYVWNSGKYKNQRKVSYLYNKWKSESFIQNNFRNIKYKDIDLTFFFIFIYFQVHHKSY